MKTLAIALIILLASCETYKYKFVKDEEFTNIDKLNKIYAKANYLKENELWIIFLKGFKNTHVVVSENEIVKFDSVITTKNDYPNFAEVFKINKKSIINVKFDSIKKSLIITESEMSKYKQIYVTKEFNRFTIEFNNGNKPRMDYIKANRKNWNRQAKKAIKDSIKLLEKN